MTLSTSQQQFLASESRDAGLQYERRGGWFVTKCVCCLFVVVAVLVAVITGVVTFYLSREKSLFHSQNDIWSEPQSYESAPSQSQNPRLPKSISPSFYRLKLVPKLNESTFSGEVYITLRTEEKDVNKIVLHSKDLHIREGLALTEQIYENIQIPKNDRSKRQTNENNIQTVSNSTSSLKPDTTNTESLNGTNAASTNIVNPEPINNVNPSSANNLNPASTNSLNPASTNNLNPASTNNLNPASTNNLNPASTNNLNPASTNNLNPASTNNLNPASTNNVNSPSTKNGNPINSESTDSLIPKLENNTNPELTQSMNSESRNGMNPIDSNYTSPEVTNSTNLDRNGGPSRDAFIPAKAFDEFIANKTESVKTPASEKDNTKVVTVTQVTRSNTRKIIVASVNNDKDTEQLTIRLDSSLKPNTDYVLEISFDGNITESLNGFYKSSYLDLHKQTQVLGITQFEPTAARAAFPCFDEPQFKAKFEISIAHRDNMTALSNMPVTSIEPMTNNIGWSWTHFDRSVKMSTYLVAYAIMDFKYLETSYVSTDNETKVIRVWARPALINQAKYALSITPKLLQFYEKMFGIPYVLSKMDLIAVPDFSSEAMENWGLITFRESALLLDEKLNVSRERQLVAINIAHELAHQWFGNLVTMSWWTDLWLNEGFATYVQYVGVDHIEPAWNILETLTQEQMDLLRSDALRHTTPVSMVVADDSDIAQKFNEISYGKGCSLIRMLNHTISQKLFWKGLHHYLKKWKYSNAVEDDLWASMSVAVSSDESALNISVVQFMDSWTRQAGYPVVAVDRNYSTGAVVFTQNIFSTVPSTTRQHQLWRIPISYAVVDSAPHDWDTKPKLWLEEKQRVVDIPLTNSQALLVNIDSIGYYRVNYDNQNWQHLISALSGNTETLPATARAQLVDDAFNLAKVSLLPYQVALQLTTFLRGEKSRFVWETALGNLGFLKFTLRNTQYYSDFQDYLLKLMQPILAELNYGLTPPRSDNEALLAESLVSWECEAGGRRCIDWARGLFRQIDETRLNESAIPSNLRAIVYTEGVRYGARAEFDLLWRVFTSSGDPNLQATAVSALAATRDDSLVVLLLERSLSEMPTQYAASAWNLEYPSGARIAQEFFISRWTQIYKKFGKMDPFLFSSIISGAFGSICTQDELDKFKAFVEQNAEELKPNLQNLLKMADSASLRINWMRTHSEAVGSWLREHNGKATKPETKDESNSVTNTNVPVGHTQRATNTTSNTHGAANITTINTQEAANSLAINKQEAENKTIPNIASVTTVNNTEKISPVAPSALPSTKK